MNSRYQFADEAERPIVYVRPVSVADLPKEMQEQAMGHKTLYAVCTSEGEQLALVRDRSLAFVLARQNDMQPVTVH